MQMNSPPRSWNATTFSKSKQSGNVLMSTSCLLLQICWQDAATDKCRLYDVSVHVCWWESSSLVPTKQRSIAWIIMEHLCTFRTLGTKWYFRTESSTEAVHWSLYTEGLVWILVQLFSSFRRSLADRCVESMRWFHKHFWMSSYSQSTVGRRLVVVYILKEKSNLPSSIFPFKFYFDKPNDMYSRTTWTSTCIQQFNANCLSRSIQIDFIPLHFSLWSLFARKNESG